MKLGEIIPSDIARVIVKAINRGKQPSTVLHIYNLMHKMFSDAIELFEILDKNPVKKRLRPVVSNIERTYLKPDEVCSFLQSIKDHHLGSIIWIICLTGLRSGEATALKWDSIDFDNNEILIKRAWNKGLRKMQEYPKGKRQIRVPMINELNEYLKEKSRGKLPNNFVTLNSQGQFVHYEYLRDNLKKLLKKASLKKVSLHELRHSTSEIFINSGASKEDISRLLNHKTTAVTNRYIHRTDESLKRLANKIILFNPNEEFKTTAEIGKK